MIHEFSVQNFYSIGENVTVDFTTTASKAEAKELYHKSPIGNKYVSKIEFIGGANASGKTNVLRTLAFLKFLITSVVQKDDSYIYFIPFLPYADRHRSTKISVVFSDDNVVYRYDVELDMERIIHETLEIRRVITKRATKTLIFDRKWIKDHYNIELYNKLGNIRIINNIGQLLEDNCRTSFIPLVAAFDDENGVIQRVYNYWLNLVTNINVNGVNEANRSMSKISEAALRSLYDNKELYEKAKDILKKYDIGFDEIVEKRGSTGKDNDIFYIVRHKYDNGAIGLLTSMESSGTQRMIILIKDALMALSEKNGIAVLDEFDAFLHPNIFEEIVELFMSNNTNPNNAQLIFSSQQYSILSELDKQQIILTEKNKKGETEVWRLDEVEGVDKSDNFYTKYLNGVYGGVPRIGL